MGRRNYIGRVVKYHEKRGKIQTCIRVDIHPRSKGEINHLTIFHWLVLAIQSTLSHHLTLLLALWILNHQTFFAILSHVTFLTVWAIWHSQKSRGHWITGNIELPPSWSTFYSSEHNITHKVEEQCSSTQPLVISHSLTVQADMTWSLLIYGQTVICEECVAFAGSPDKVNL